MALLIFTPTLSKLLRPLVSHAISAGFPSPAMDFDDVRIDLNAEVMRHPLSTYFARVKGTSMQGAGIDDGDLLVIDRSLEPGHGRIAVCFLDGEFTAKRIILENGFVYLAPENPNYPRIKVTEENDFVVWGVVTFVVKAV